MQTILNELKQLGTEQNRKIYRRHGVKGELYGVSYANLKALQKRIKCDQALAEQLWASANHDARVLATMIADPKTISSDLIDNWLKDLDNQTITDAFCSVIAKTDKVKHYMESWIDADNEWISRSGWSLLSSLANNDANLADDFFFQYLKTIEDKIHNSKNWVKAAMNMALITIGSRNESLMAKALESAAKIGKVEVDHGETNCKTPDAAEYIKKTVAHRNKKLVKS